MSSFAYDGSHPRCGQNMLSETWECAMSVSVCRILSSSRLFWRRYLIVSLHNFWDLNRGKRSPCKPPKRRIRREKMEEIEQPKDTVLCTSAFCNSLKYRDVQEARACGARTPSQVFRAHGAEVQCGKCVDCMKSILKDGSLPPHLSHAS